MKGKYSFKNGSGCTLLYSHEDRDREALLAIRHRD